MKYFKTINTLIIAIVILFFITGCNSADKKNQTVALFIPHPVIVEKQEVTTLKIGQKAPDFTLPDMNGKYVSLNDFKDSKVLVIFFTCNHCPTAQAYEDRMVAFTNDYKTKGVSVIAIMPNSSAGLLLEECGYSDLDDSFENMALRAKDKKYNFPYLYDGDDQSVSIKYGPTTTPHAFVFDKSKALRYVGRLDSIEKPGLANAEDLRKAVNEILAGQTVSNPVTKTFGCSVKWSWKSEWAQKVNKDWEQKPIGLEKIDEEGIHKLLTNNSKKLRLVNVWATWCAPCVVELPDLINLQRMYGNRDFEFITISADKPGSSEKVLEFLKGKHSAIQNFIFSSEDKYRLIEAIDRNWNGALPYTILIEPGGNIVYRNQGIVDFPELKKKIVEHPLLGRYY